MAKEWPFEDTSRKGSSTEAAARGFKQPQDFLAARGTEGAEAVIVRIGLHDAQLVLIDGQGFWDRWVYHSTDEASEAARSLGVPVTEGEFPEKTRVRINSYRRVKEDYERAAYPEQGVVGPVIPYPENRPRELQESHLKALRERKKKDSAD